MTEKRTRSKASMWSTIDAAVEAGWGATWRLLAILTVLGALVVGVAHIAGESAIVEILATLLSSE